MNFCSSFKYILQIVQITELQNHRIRESLSFLQDVDGKMSMLIPKIRHLHFKMLALSNSMN